MKNSKRRLCSLLLAVAMCFTLATPVVNATSLSGATGGVVTFDDKDENNGVVTYDTDNNGSVVTYDSDDKKSSSGSSDDGGDDNQPNAKQGDNQSSSGAKEDDTKNGEATAGDDQQLASQSSENNPVKASTKGLRGAPMLLGAGNGETGDPPGPVSVPNRVVDAETPFDAKSVTTGEVWVDKSVFLNGSSETGFTERLAVFAKKAKKTVTETQSKKYGPGNYVIVVDTTRSLYSATNNDDLVDAVGKATNNIVKEIAKVDGAKIAVVGFSADNTYWDGHKKSPKNPNSKPTTDILSFGDWSKAAGKGDLIQAKTDGSNELKWWIGATDNASSNKPSGGSTNKRYISYGTFTQGGIARAAQILKKNASSDKTGYMILISDGVPTFATSAWKSEYSASDKNWQNTADGNSIGEGRGWHEEGPKCVAYTMLTAQYWYNQLNKVYDEAKFYAVHLNNDDYDSEAQKAASWLLGVRNKYTYSASKDSSPSTNSRGFNGTLISGGYPQDRLHDDWDTKKGTKWVMASSGNSADNGGVGKFRELVKNNYKALGLSSKNGPLKSPFNAQYADLSAKSLSTGDMARLITNSMKNIKATITSETSHEEDTEPLKSGTNVVFTTKTMDYLKVVSDPVINYRGTAYSASSHSGDTYTYSIAGTTNTVVVKQNELNSEITCTFAGALVNKNAMDNINSRIHCKYNVDLTTSDYSTLPENFQSFTNAYSSGNESKVTYTAVSEVDGETAKKGQNKTGTLKYVTKRPDNDPNKTTTVLLGNNGKISYDPPPPDDEDPPEDPPTPPETPVDPTPPDINIVVYERDQSGTERKLPEVTYEIRTSDGSSVVVTDGVTQTFNSTTVNPVTTEIAPGNYILRVTSVPEGHVKPADQTITVRDTDDEQNYVIDVDTTQVRIWSYDKFTKEKIPQDGTKVNIINNSTNQVAKISNWTVSDDSVERNGQMECRNVPIEWARERFPVGDFKIQVTTVPNRYLMPSETTPMKVLEQRPEQLFTIPLEHLGSIIIHKKDDSGNPMKGVKFELRDSNGNVVLPVQTTDDNGIARFIDNQKLVPGDYFLTELKTVQGKTLLAHQIKVTIPRVYTDAEFNAIAPQYKVGQVGNVNTEQDILNATQSLAWHDIAGQKWAIYDLNFDIVNDHTFGLPSTGSTQTKSFQVVTVIGMTSLLAAAAFIAKKKVLDNE